MNRITNKETEENKTRRETIFNKGVLIKL